MWRTSTTGQAVCRQACSRRDPAFRNDVLRHFTWRSDGGRHWLRIDVRNADGKLILLGNPVYLNKKNKKKCDDKLLQNYLKNNNCNDMTCALLQRDMPFS